MIEWYEMAPVVAGIIVAVLAWRVPRAAVWVALLLVSFVSSSLWWNLGMPYPAAFGASTDLIIALIMLKYARNQWEHYILNCYALMILIEGLQQLGQIPSKYYYALSLEAVNWFILLLIGATGLVDRLQGYGDRGRGFHPSGMDVARSHLVSPRRYPRWWRAWE